MAWGAVAGAAVGVVGNSLLSDSGGNTSTQKQEMNPNVAKYVYGSDGNGGLLADAQGIYKKQFAQGGLNPVQLAGLEMQRQYLMSPQYQQGYADMQSAGRSLMGGGVAGNPFTNGSIATMFGNQGGRQPVPMQGGQMAVTTQQPQQSSPYDQMVRNAYHNIGRDGLGTMDNQIDQQGYDHWMNKLNSGLMNPAQFESEFNQAANRNEPQRYDQYIGSKKPFQYSQGTADVQNPMMSAYQPMAQQTYQPQQADNQTGDIQKIIDDYLAKNGYEAKGVMPNPVGDMFKAAGISF